MGFLDKFIDALKSEDDFNESTTEKKKEPKNSIACPYCGSVLNPAPKRKKKCPDCSKTIYVRTTEQLFNSNLLTEEQALASDFFKELINYGASVSDYQRKEEQLQDKWGFKPSPYDVVWSVSNDLIVNGPNLEDVYDKTRETLYFAKSISFSQALYQLRRGNDPTSYLIGVNNYDIDLAKTLGIGIAKMEILGDKCCDNCAKLNGKTFSLEELKSKKILPNKVCTRKLNKDDKHSWCVCMYLTVIPR